MKPFPLFLAVGFLCFLPLRLPASEEPRFPFSLPWDDATPGVTDMSGLLEKPAGAHGFVQARPDGHLYAGDRRIRFFGVNTTFGANFPTHEAAEGIAARMAKFGIGCVRFHHMDTQKAPAGILQADRRTLDPERLDRLDYFIARLKAHGIYANLNLHVGNVYPGMPAWEKHPSFFKGVDLFYPPLLEAQRDYARQLLRHVNPYTHTAYADEPAVAFVEINNENGLISEWWSGSLDAMPEPYRAELEAPWNRWLQARYPSQEALQKAWNLADQPSGGELLREGNFAGGLGSAWTLEQHFGAKAATAKLPEGEGGLRLHVEKTGSLEWHLQLSQPLLSLEGDKSYTLAFRARAAAGTPRRVSVDVGQAHAPWGLLWSAKADLGPEWKEYRFVFQVTDREPNARVVFGNLGESGADLDFADVSLRPGGRFGLSEGEHLGALPLFIKSSFASRTAEAQRDWLRFLWETEEAYWTGMRCFLRDEIRTHSLLVGTAAEYSLPQIQAAFDVVDSHAYWQHPNFPRKPWDLTDWTVAPLSMAGIKGGGTLPGLALRRVEGKPFICTEYNAPSPNPHAAEAFLLVSAFAGLQDWDALFAFEYSGRTDDWDSRRQGSFFDIDQNSAKLVTLPAAVSLFVRGDLPKAAATRTLAVSQDQALEYCRRRGTWWAAENVIGMPWQDLFRVAFQIGNASSASATGESSPLFWDTPHARAAVDAPRGKALIGQGSGEPIALGEVGVAFQGWAALALTAIDGPDFHSPGRVLICAAGSVENTGMVWKSAAKDSVGRDWGRAPVLAEGIAARVTLPLPPARMKAWALDERGQRGAPIPLQAEGSGSALNLGPEHCTLWYEVEISGDLSTNR